MNSVNSDGHTNRFPELGTEEIVFSLVVTWVLHSLYVKHGHAYTTIS